MGSKGKWQKFPMVGDIVRLKGCKKRAFVEHAHTDMIFIRPKLGGLAWWNASELEIVGIGPGEAGPTRGKRKP